MPLAIVFHSCNLPLCLIACSCNLPTCLIAAFWYNVSQLQFAIVSHNFHLQLTNVLVTRCSHVSPLELTIVYHSFHLQFVIMLFIATTCHHILQLQFATLAIHTHWQRLTASHAMKSSGNAHAETAVNRFTCHEEKHISFGALGTNLPAAVNQQIQLFS